MKNYAYVVVGIATNTEQYIKTDGFTAKDDAAAKDKVLKETKSILGKFFPEREYTYGAWEPSDGGYVLFVKNAEDQEVFRSRVWEEQR